MEIVKMQSVTKIYENSANKVKAINDLSLNIEEGEMIAIIGESGSGKSTLLSLIAGLEHPTVGNVYINTQNYQDLSVSEICELRRKYISVIYQFYNIIPTLTVEENITLPILIDNKTVDQNKLNELLEKLKLSNKKNLLITELSGGQQQKVAIGRTLITQSKLILADEPTGNLDSVSSSEVVALLESQNKENNTTIIIATHNLEIAKQCDRIITLKDGSVVSDVRKEE